jgi:hypothetical protein
MVLGVWLLIGQRSQIRRLFHDGFKASYDELGQEPLPSLGSEVE